MDTDLVLLLMLILVSGAFSGAEIALTSLSPAKVETLKNDKKFGSHAIYRLKQKPESLLITILVGNNLVNILATVLATIWGVRVFGDNALGIITGGLTFIVLIFGEIAPKTYAQKHALTFARFVAKPLLFLTIILFPVIWLLEHFIHFLMKLLKAQSPIKTMSEEEILAMVDIGAQEGVIEEHEQELIENVLEFTETTVEEIMTAKESIESLDINTSVRDAAHYFTTHSHSRIPVFKENIDNVVGILTVHDILKITHDEKHPVKCLEDFKYTHPILVPKTKSISKLFREFQKRRKHIAIVVDENGYTVGLVTLEDILEEIVGEIVDEQDKEYSKIRSVGKNEWEADASANIEELNEALKVKIDYPEHKSISLLILEKLQGFPSLGQYIEFENLEFKVTKMTKKKIETVVITKH